MNDSKYKHIMNDSEYKHKRVMNEMKYKQNAENMNNIHDFLFIKPNIA